MTNSKQRCLQKLKHYIKRVDAFGVPVSLTYKNDPYFKSITGGVVTIISRLLVLGFLIQ